MTSTSVKVIWADFGSIYTRLTRNLLIFNPCAQDETRTHTSRRQYNDRCKFLSPLCSVRLKTYTANLCEQIRKNIAQAIDAGEDVFCVDSKPLQNHYKTTTKLLLNHYLLPLNF